MRSFRLNIILRVLLITGLIAVSCYYFFAEQRYLRTVYFSLFTVLAVWELMYYNNRTNRDISTFLLSLLQQDFTTTFRGEPKGRSFSQLYDSMNAVTQRFKRLSAEREARHLYLEALIEHVQIGLISFDEKERIHLVNDSFRKYSKSAVIQKLTDIGPGQPELLEAIRGMRPGFDQLIRLNVDNSLIPMNLHMTEFIAGGRKFRLLSLQNIREALDRQEVESYQKLIRVLTHEIMNSVSPISSLSESLYKKVSARDTISGETRDNIEKGLEAIQVRSRGLQTFTEAYKQLTRIPQPVFEVVNVKSLIHRVIRLVDDERVAADDIPPELQIKADPGLMEQVLLNLITNALDATEGKKNAAVTVTGESEGSFVKITVSDNGKGIDPDKIDKIFVPFFTTKEKGSGIGLALSRQIIKLHGGGIEVTSVQGEGSRVWLYL